MSFKNYSPDLEQFSLLITSVAFSGSTFLLPITVYLIATRSKTMKKYKYYLLNSITWCYTFQLLIFFNRPSLLFPSFCVIFQPISQIFVHPQIIKYTIYACVICSINMCLSVVWALCYRFSQAFPGWLGELFDQSNLIWVLIGTVQFSLYAIIAVPFIWGLVDDQVEVKRQFLNENPDLDSYSGPIVCFVNNRYSTLLGLVISLACLLFFVIGTALTYVLYVRIQMNKKYIKYGSTHRLQMMLFIAVMMQLFIGYLFLLFPVTFVGFLVFFQVPNTGKICSIVLAIMSVHGIADYSIVLFCVAPYRRALAHWMRLSPERSSNSRVHIAVTSTNPN